MSEAHLEAGNAATMTSDAYDNLSLHLKCVLQLRLPVKLTPASCNIENRNLWEYGS